MDIAKRFGANLARVREKAGLSQEAVGWLATLHRTEISLLERGTRVPRIDTLVKLAGALKVSPCDLLVGIHWNPPRSEFGAFRIASPPPAPKN